MTIVSGRLHTSAPSVTGMPGTSHFPAPVGPFRAGIEGPITRCRLLVPYGGPKVDNAPVTVGRHGRKRGVLDVSVTGSDLRHGSVSLPSLPRHAPVTVLPCLSYPALSPRPQPAQGRGERAASLSPGASFRGHIPPLRASSRRPRPSPKAPTGTGSTFRDPAACLGPTISGTTRQASSDAIRSGSSRDMRERGTTLSTPAASASALVSVSTCE